MNNYKNIDKSTHLIFNEKDTFKVFHFNNLSDKTQLFKYSLNTNYIQLFFGIEGENCIAFNIEHCAITLAEQKSNMVYFKTDEMNLLFKIQPKSEFIAVLISID
ncbi:MAG TPA: hypothetical protein VJ970_00525, partial [Flavobacteriaceae bacterium]|nr:hypothetical protein [Flavobacteriaceae bacterium]